MENSSKISDQENYSWPRNHSPGQGINSWSKKLFTVKEFIFLVNKNIPGQEIHTPDQRKLFMVKEFIFLVKKNISGQEIHTPDQRKLFMVKEFIFLVKKNISGQRIRTPSLRNYSWSRNSYTVKEHMPLASVVSMIDYNR